jgi:hypothetical protein
MPYKNWLDEKYTHGDRRRPEGDPLAAGKCEPPSWDLQNTIRFLKLSFMPYKNWRCMGVSSSRIMDRIIMWMRCRTIQSGWINHQSCYMEKWIYTHGCLLRSLAGACGTCTGGASHGEDSGTTASGASGAIVGRPTTWVTAAAARTSTTEILIWTWTILNKEKV